MAFPSGAWEREKERKHSIHNSNTFVGGNNMKKTIRVVIPEVIEQKIILVRGQKVILDSHIAQLYGVETNDLKRAVRGNIERFPEDFMLQLTAEEYALLRRQFGALKRGGRRDPAQSLSGNEKQIQQIQFNYSFFGGEAMKKGIGAGVPEVIEQRILMMRGQKIMLSIHLAELYGVETRALNQAVKRNAGRFPADFMFQLTAAESDRLVSQNVIPHRKHLGGSFPYAFTEQGVAMLSTVLKSERAVLMNIAIMSEGWRCQEHSSNCGKFFPHIKSSHCN